MCLLYTYGKRILLRETMELALLIEAQLVLSFGQIGYMHAHAIDRIQSDEYVSLAKSDARAKS